MWKTDVGITGKMSTGCSGDTIGNIRNDLKKMFSHCIHLCIYSEIFFFPEGNSRTARDRDSVGDAMKSY